MAAECGNIHKSKINMYGFGIPGQGFYSMSIPEAKFQTEKVLGLITVLEGAATEQKVDRELKNLIDEEWDFKIRMLANGEFMACFRDELSVEMFSKFNAVDLALYGLKVKISRTKMEASATAVLQPAWVKLFGIPDMAREEEIVK